MIKKKSKLSHSYRNLFSSFIIVIAHNVSYTQWLCSVFQVPNLCIYEKKILFNCPEFWNREFLQILTVRFLSKSNKGCFCAWLIIGWIQVSKNFLTWAFCKTNTFSGPWRTHKTSLKTIHKADTPFSNLA